MEMKVQLSEDQEKWLRGNTKLVVYGGGVYFNIPHWYAQTEQKGVYEEIGFKDLPPLGDSHPEDYFNEENDFVRKNFDLEAIMLFQLGHDVQIIRGEDWQYGCWIDKKMYGTALTTLGALVTGIELYYAQYR